MPDGTHAAAPIDHHRNATPALTIAAIGIVLGNIGTSPLYALDQMFFGAAGIAPTPDNVLGCISLVIWSLILIVCIKYAILVLRADNDGEGGVFALYSLLHSHRESGRIYVYLLGGLMLGAGLLVGDGIISPAISVLSAVEGLKVATPVFGPVVIPITMCILGLLFAAQYRGTAGVGRVFGPVLIVWFIVIAALGARQIVNHADILQAFNPVHGMAFLTRTPLLPALSSIGALMLVVTGGEAMYADLGHFGVRPLRIGWFALAFPALVLNYLGQGALMLTQPPTEGGQLFFSMVPPVALLPMVLLATLATVVAAQALISGTFSLAAQAIALGLFPRLRVVHTHHAHEGQIYLPVVNWAMFAGCAALVLWFRSSGALAAAYGLAVSGVMVVTSFAMIAIAIHVWKWSALASGAVFGAFTLVNLLFSVASGLKFFDGGFIPLGIGLAVFVVMRAWRWGRKATFAAYTGVRTMPMRTLVALHTQEQVYLERIALLMTPKHLSSPEDKAPALLQLLYDRHGLLPRHLVFVEVAHRKVPYIHDSRYDITVFHKDRRSSIVAVTVQFGFMEEPNVEAVLEDLAKHAKIALPLDEHKWIVHVSVENLVPARNIDPLSRLRLKLFAIMRQMSAPAHYFYGLGDNVQLSAEIMPVRLK